MDLVVGYSSEDEIERRVDPPVAQAAPPALNVFARMMTQAKAAASPRNALSLPSSLLHEMTGPLSGHCNAIIICTFQQREALLLITVTLTYSPRPCWSGGKIMVH
jgi:hypothetical protein